ncbi:MAG: GAF domain-containing protein [Chloroflexi bacterium]|nr:GAF domain-containing protein [Chloroflexota bacterium]
MCGRRARQHHRDGRLRQTRGCDHRVRQAVPRPHHTAVARDDGTRAGRLGGSKPQTRPGARHQQGRTLARRADDAVEKTGAKSAICVPLMARERMVGVLTLVHPVPNTFNGEHLELMQAIADRGKHRGP